MTEAEIDELDARLSALAEKNDIPFVAKPQVEVIDGWVTLVELRGLKISQRMDGKDLAFRVAGECELTPGEFAFLASWFDTCGWIGPWEGSGDT